MADRPEKPVLLVLRHHGLGDLLTAQPALRGLRRKFPEHELVVSCPSWLLDLAQFFHCADRFISEVCADETDVSCLVVPSDHRSIDPTLTANVLRDVSKADVLVSLRTPDAALLQIASATAPRLLVSYRHPSLAATYPYPELDFSDHILTRWKRLLGAIEVEINDSDLYADIVPPPSESGHSIVHIGAGSPARTWPEDRWIEIIRHLESRGHRTILTGSRGEGERIERVCRAAGLAVDRVRCGTTAMELAELAAGARLLLCVDTGISHLATALRRPSITLFGPVPPACWGPPPGNPRHRTLWTGRTGDTYGSESDRGLLEISAECVRAAVDALHREDI
jgi:hypothetical protein